MSLRVAFDVDGVLADFRSSFQAMARGARTGFVDRAPESEQLAEAALTSRDLRRVWRQIVRTPNWWAKLPAYEPAQIERLFQLSRDLKWEILFVTRRPETAGEPVQFQTQWWLEQHGFRLPSVVTVQGSRGELANAVRLDMLVDDELHNCFDVVSASQTKAMMVLRDASQTSARDQAAGQGIGVVDTLEAAIDILERVNDILVARKGRLSQIADWFAKVRQRDQALSVPSREMRPLPPLE